MKTYHDYDCDNDFNNTIIAATNLWKNICKENYKMFGDEGNCVVGAGIEIMYIPPRCRKPRREMIISSRDVACAQGSLNWERGKDHVISYLRDNGIDAIYNWGMMD